MTPPLQQSLSLRLCLSDSFDEFHSASPILFQALSFIYNQLRRLHEIFRLVDCFFQEMMMLELTFTRTLNHNFITALANNAART